MEKHHHLLLFLFFLLFCCKESQGLWPFSSASTTHPDHNSPSMALPGVAPEFSMENLNGNKNGMVLLEDARTKLAGPNTCWHNAYQSLFSNCSDIITDEEKKRRLAWHLTDCFHKTTGRSPFPACGSRDPTSRCLEKIDVHEHQNYLKFFLEINFICHQLQIDAFKHETERLVNDLANSARFAEEKLEIIKEKSDQLLQGSSKLQDSLVSLDLQTQQAAQVSRDVGNRIIDVLKHSEAIFEQSKEIAASQVELREGQTLMKERLESGIARLQESYETIGNGMESLRKETIEIEREIKQVGDSMSSKMQDLHSTASDIGKVAGISLEKQRMLLDGQATALEGLDFLKRFQSQALEESRDTLQKLAEFGHQQQEELLQRQEIIQKAHDRLINNSQSILTAQKEFESKQASIFAALDKLYKLHNAILVESRFIKAFFFYATVIFLLYMLTSAKQTFGIRARLYLGFCITFVVELGVIRLGPNDFDHQTWITSKVFLVRTSFLVIASIQILHSIFTYRDYEILNHQLLQSLVEKVCAMEQNTGNKFLSSRTESEISLSQYSWIDEEFPEEVSSNIDPDYMPEGVEDNFFTTNSVTRKYSLRPRAR